MRARVASVESDTAIGGRDVVARTALRALPGWPVVLLAIGWYLTARLGVGFRFEHSPIGVVWPPNAVLLAGLLLTPRRRWWVVLGATAVAHYAALSPLVPAWRWCWQITDSSLFGVIEAELLRRFAGLPLHFGNRRQVLAYTAISFLSSAVFGLTIPSFIRSVAGLEAYGAGATWLHAALSNGTALLLVTPVIVLWARRSPRDLRALPPRRVREATIVLMSLLGVGAVALGTGPGIASLPWLLLCIYPPLLWAAVRFGPTGAATSLLGIAAISIWGAARRLGPFVLVGNAYQVLSLQLFWIALSAPVMLLAAVMSEREQVENALQEQRNQLAHATRAATVGTLSGSLAHELRQPLTSILANAEAGMNLLNARVVDVQELRAILDDIRQQDQHAASILSHVRSFMRTGEVQFQTIALEEVGRDALRLARGTLAASCVQLEARLGAGTTLVRGDPLQLLQVLLNLIVNACEAMSGKPAPDRHLWLQIACVAPNLAEVQIVDSGTGLPSGQEDRVLDPFFTTKEQGLGLGLAISGSIVKAHGGRLWGENNSRGGATFHFVLPIATPSAVAGTLT
jgi:signal transduction histidine kinase